MVSQITCAFSPMPVMNFQSPNNNFRDFHKNSVDFKAPNSSSHSSSTGKIVSMCSACLFSLLHRFCFKSIFLLVRWFVRSLTQHTNPQFSTHIKCQRFESRIKTKINVNSHSLDNDNDDDDGGIKTDVDDDDNRTRYAWQLFHRGAHHNWALSGLICMNCFECVYYCVPWLLWAADFRLLCLCVPFCCLFLIPL